MNRRLIGITTLLILFQNISLSGQYIAQTEDPDTIRVSAVTFQDPSPEGWGAAYHTTVTFPPPDRWRRILMVQTLKCDSSTKADNYPCGEWDYIWDTFLQVPTDDSVEVFSLGSFVTPYGKRLQLGGETGWRWLYDVTRYAPLLSGERELVTGNNQELLELEFLFIRGVPVRDVLEVRNIYPYGNYRYELLADDSLLQALKIPLLPDADGYSVLARISGHGHHGPHNCCEWESKTHTYRINRWERFRWHVWKDCGFNPIYPQGGTWPFDRAGWCPGTRVDEYEFELTPLVMPGDTILFDYEIEPYADNGEKDGSFRMSHQLISYGPPNFRLDAAVADVLSPTSEPCYGRLNPSCGSVRIRLRNEGARTLKQVELLYGFAGEARKRYEWIGQLEFLEIVDVDLPPLDWHQHWLNPNSSNRFQVQIKSANGAMDANAANNMMTTTPEFPPLYPTELVLEIQTNDLGRARENACSITSPIGDVLFEQTRFLDDTTYRFPLSLPEGCYRFRFQDTAEDGISRHWWNYQEAPEWVGKNGRILMLSAEGDTLHRFLSDFGQELYLEFMTIE